jgi:U1 small nuclear ribonucleoprotein 70kDa
MDRHWTDNPADDPQIRGDPFRTLFVSRLSYDTKEHDLEREFAKFGPIERVNLYYSVSK